MFSYHKLQSVIWVIVQVESYKFVDMYENSFYRMISIVRAIQLVLRYLQISVGSPSGYIKEKERNSIDS